jgi:4-alpha-glucanotransferase
MLGVIVPIVSLPSSQSWGLGELRDLATFGDWASAAGFDRVMILPLGTMPDAETSPYSAVSTMAIDPRYVAIEDVEDFSRAGGVAALSHEARERLAAARSAPVLRYEDARIAKREALGLAFDAFERREWFERTTRAAALAGFIARERPWLDDYALFRALAQAHPGLSWRAWPPPIRDREPAALDRARRDLAREVLREQYWQWLAEIQWQAARARLRELGVGVVGDAPFAVALESPEIWARASEYLLDVSAGVPPDAFSDAGQDWNLPAYHWEAVRATGYEWLRARARRAGALFDGVRVDHLVGLYRTYGRPAAGPAFFTPATEADQLSQGEEVLRVWLGSGLDVIAEDLGTVPDFVRQSMARLGVPGCKVLRWERDWRHPAAPFVDPATFPPVSAGLTSTHDNEPLAAWWDEAPLTDRAALLALPLMRSRVGEHVEQPWSDGLRDALVELLYSAGSRHVFALIQDLFGWRDRINLPGTVGAHNWTWRLPWPVDRLRDQPEAIARAAFLRRIAALRRGPTTGSNTGGSLE